MIIQKLRSREVVKKIGFILVSQSRVRSPHNDIGAVQMLLEYAAQTVTKEAI